MSATLTTQQPGDITRKFSIPDSRDEIPRAWAYVTHDDGILFGTSTIREELEKRLRRRGRTAKSKTDSVFAVDPKTGDQLWAYRGKNILHTMPLSLGTDDSQVASRLSWLLRPVAYLAPTS